MSKKSKAVESVVRRFQSQIPAGLVLEMKQQEPAIRAMRKAYRASKQFQLDSLRARESRWQRKSTIADNKLAEVRKEINDLLWELVHEADQKAPEQGGAK